MSARAHTHLVELRRRHVAYLHRGARPLVVTDRTRSDAWVYVYMYGCVRACLCARARACVHACVRVRAWLRECGRAVYMRGYLLAVSAVDNPAAQRTVA